MRKFRKKPVVIQAMTFEELDNKHTKYLMSYEVEGPYKTFNVNGHKITHEGVRSFIIHTHEGAMTMTENDVLIIGVEGEIYPCKKDIFEKTYEEVSYIDENQMELKV